MPGVMSFRLGVKNIKAHVLGLHDEHEWYTHLAASRNNDHFPDPSPTRHSRSRIRLDGCFGTQRLFPPRQRAPIVNPPS